MRICLPTTEFITEDNFDGGLSNYLYRLSLSLKILGHEPFVFFLDKKSMETKCDGFTLIKVKNSVFHFQKKMIKWNFVYKLLKPFFLLLNSFEINNKIRKMNEDVRFDIIQYPHLNGLALCRPKNIPTVIRMSSYTPLVLKANNIAGGYQQNFWEQLSIRRVEAIFSPSKLVAEIESKILKKNVHIIESPFIIGNKNYDYLIHDNFLKGKKYFLFFGTLSSLKGIELIGKIVKKILSDDPDLYFAFVGKDLGINGIPAIDYLNQMAKPFNDRVIYINKIHHKFLYPVIVNSVLIILPSRFDNFPNTCIEAMAHRKIVIGTKGTSFEQLITDGENGFLCEIDDPISLLNKIDTIQNLSFDEKKRIEENAYKRIQLLSPEIVGLELVDFYSYVIDNFKKNKKV